MCFDELNCSRCVASSSVRRFPSSQAARMVMALAGPTPLNLHKSLMLILPSAFKLSSQLCMTRCIRATAFSSLVPEPMRMARSSAVDNAPGPFASNFSRGRSSKLKSVMFMTNVQRVVNIKQPDCVVGSAYL